MSITIYYLPLQAKGEIPRLILSYGKIPFENSVITFQEWGSTEKSSNEKHLFGQLPSAKLPSGKLLSQSGSISRYFAKLAHIYPSDPEACAEADMIYELTQDMNDINPLVTYFVKDSEPYTAAHQKYFSALPARLTACAKMLGDKQFFGGSAPHYGDLALFHICDATTIVKSDALEAFPTLVAWKNRSASLPGVAEYLAKRPRAPDVGMPGSVLNPSK